MGAVPKDIHTEIGTQYTTPYAFSFLETWRHGDSTQEYIYGDRDTIYHPYTLSFLEAWGRGDVGTVRMDIPTEIGTQYTTPLYTLIFGGLGT